MRTERRKSGSERGDEKLASERQHGAHRLLNRFMHRLNNGMTRNYAASLLLSHGAGSVLLSVPLHMRPGASGYVQQCLRFTRNACAPMQSLFPRISCAIGLYLVLYGVAVLSTLATKISRCGQWPAATSQTKISPWGPRVDG